MRAFEARFVGRVVTIRGLRGLGDSDTKGQVLATLSWHSHPAGCVRRRPVGSVLKAGTSLEAGRTTFQTKRTASTVQGSLLLVVISGTSARPVRVGVELDM